MAQYKLTRSAYINNQLLGEGTVVTVPDDFIPGPHMVPVDAAAKKAMKREGIIPDSPRDYVADLTSSADFSPASIGASPQDVKSGILHTGGLEAEALLNPWRPWAEGLQIAQQLEQENKERESHAEVESR